MATRLKTACGYKCGEVDREMDGEVARRGGVVGLGLGLGWALPLGVGRTCL